jgi:hypothetical protein
MGCSFSNVVSNTCCYSPTKDVIVHGVKYNVAFKLPNGVQYLDFEKNELVLKEDVNNWIYSVYKDKKFTNYINYNDEHKDKISSHGGHCKGCIAWNDTEVCWLIHSVPKFMIVFEDGSIDTTKTMIAHGEQIYGQSFIFVSHISINELENILYQISVMHPFIDTDYSSISLPSLVRGEEYKTSARTILLSDEIRHVAKSPTNTVDIFSEIIQKTYGGKWRCETWIRGRNCEETPNVVDNHNINFQNLSYTSTQDHSKYAVSNKNVVYIGDLNRMTSQFHRGGGGFILHDDKLAAVIRSIMDKEEMVG